MTLNGRLYSVAAPAQPGAPEQFAMSLHGMLRPFLRRWREGQPWVSLELGGAHGAVRFYMWIPLGQEAFIEDLLRASYPGVELEPVEDDPLAPTDGYAAFAPVTLSRSTNLPIRTDFDGDALAPLLSVLARPRGEDRIHMSLLMRPRANGWQTQARSEAHRLRKGGGGFLAEALLPSPKQKPTATPHQLEQAKQIEQKAGALGFDCALRVYAVADDEIRANEYLRSVAAALRPFDGVNGFAFPRVWRRERRIDEHRTRAFPTYATMLLSVPEVAALWHLPAEAPSHVEVVHSPVFAPPAEIPRTGRILGEARDQGRQRPVGLNVDDAMLQTLILGSTGTGKTSLSVRLAVEDIEAGRGIIAISGKADLLDDIQARIPASRINEVALVTAQDGASVGLNPLEYKPGDDTELLADNLHTIFRRQFERFWGPRTSQVLNACLKTLLARPDSTLDMLPLLLFDEMFRARMLSEFETIPPVLTTYWRWYESLSSGQRSEMTSPLLNKLDQILMRDRARRILCQTQSTIDLEEIMENGRILLADLSTGVWGDETSTLIGSFLIAKVWQVRRRVAARKRPTDCFVYIDEAQQFANISDDIAELLAQARSYRIALCLSQQHLGQTSREYRDALSANARNKIVFACSQEDARYFAREMPPVSAEALMALPRYRVAARLMVRGQSSRAFTFTTLPPAPVTDPSIAHAVADASRQQFARSNEAIDAEARARHGYTPATESSSARVGRRPRA